MMLTLICAQCGREFQRKSSDVHHEAKHQFCSRACTSRFHGPDRARAQGRRQRRTLFLMTGRGWLTTGQVGVLIGKQNGSAIRSHLGDLLRKGEVERRCDEMTTGKPVYWRRAARIGRVCAEPGCGTILSRYNPDDYCALHAARHMDHVEYMELCGVA